MNGRSDVHAVPRSRRKLWFGIFVAVGGVYAAIANAGGVADAVEAMRTAHWRLLVAASVAQFVNYLLLAVLLRSLVSVRSPACTPATALRLAFVLNGLGNVLPASPAEGIALTHAELLRRHVEPRRATLALGFTKWYTTRALFAVFTIDALIIVSIAEIKYPSTFPDRLTLTIIGAGVLLVLGFSAWLAQRARTAELVALIGHRIAFWRPQSPADEVRARGNAWYRDARELLGGRRRRYFIATIAMLACLADAQCFRLSLRALGVHLRPWWFLITYVAAMVAMLIPFLPAGLGAVESIVPALLRGARVPAAVALAGVVAYRAIATIAPALIGVFALVRLRTARVAPPPSVSTSA